MNQHYYCALSHFATFSSIALFQNGASITLINGHTYMPCHIHKQLSYWLHFVKHFTSFIRTKVIQNLAEIQLAQTPWICGTITQNQSLGCACRFLLVLCKLFCLKITSECLVISKIPLWDYPWSYLQHLGSLLKLPKKIPCSNYYSNDR